MKKLFIDIDTILISVSGNAVEDLIFEKDIIHTLYRISKQSNYELILVVKSKKTRVLSKAIAMLKNESIVFKTHDNADAIGSNEHYINKENFKSWNEVYEDLKSSSRKNYSYKKHQ